MIRTTALSAVMLVIVGSMLWGVGTVFFKKATMQQTTVNRYFITGGVLSIVGWTIYLPGLSMGEASVLGPLAAAAYIAEMIAARYYVDERIGRTELLGIFLILMGIVVIGSQGV